MKSTVLVVLLATVSAKVAAVEPNQPSPPTRDVACAPNLSQGEDPGQIPMVSFDETQLDSEVQKLLDAFTNNKVRSIDIVTEYERERNGLVHGATANSQLLRGSMSGSGVDDSMEDLEDKMTQLTKIMSLYNPESLEAQGDSLWSKSLRLIGRGKNQAKSITASFASNEQKIAAILEGLGNARAQIETDNALLDMEIDRVNEKLIALSTQIDLWQARERRLRQFREELQARFKVAQQGSGEFMRLKVQTEVLDTQILLPISQTISMLQNQTDIFEAAILAQRGQQEQNKLVIRTGINLEKTAAEVLPTIVTMAVTTARTARAQDIQQGAKDLMEQGLNSITRQMDKNAQRQTKMMQEGPISAAQIERFRTEVFRIVGQTQDAKLKVLADLDRSRAQRDLAIAKQKPIVDAIRDQVEFGSISGPEDVKQISGQ